jgi:transcriptional regulator with XRE-family HTH domain
MSFSQRLAAVRKGKGLTQQQAAEIIGIHLSQMKRYESGDTQPSLEVLRRIALALNVSADRLLFDEHERGPADEFRMLCEALTRFNRKEKQIAMAVLESLVLKHTSDRLAPKKDE